MLHFYWFCRSYKGDELAKKYKDDIDAILKECNFSPLYIGNPYDALFRFIFPIPNSSAASLFYYKKIYYDDICNDYDFCSRICLHSP